MLLVALFGTAAAVFLQRATRVQEKLLLATADETVRLKFDTGIERLSDAISLLATTLAPDERLQNALAERNHDALTRDWSETHARLRERHQVIRFSFLDTDLRYLARLHNPTTFNEIPDRPTLQKAARTQSAVIGIETGTRGQPSLRLAYPVRRADQLVGYLDLGMSLNGVLNPARPGQPDRTRSLSG